jgi:hypothetical protein
LSTLLGIFAACALLLSVVGLYGVMMYSVTERVPEIGIRLTLGAQRSQIPGMVAAQGAEAGADRHRHRNRRAFALTRILSRFLYGVGVALLLIAVALLASYLPAAAPPGSTPSSLCVTNEKAGCQELCARAALRSITLCSASARSSTFTGLAM